jgi:hypothetical protein
VGGFEGLRHKRNGNNQATAAVCQALIHSSDKHRDLKSKMPNSRKKSREFGISHIVAKPAVENLFGPHCWFG